MGVEIVWLNVEIGQMATSSIENLREWGKIHGVKTINFSVSYRVNHSEADQIHCEIFYS